LPGDDDLVGKTKASIIAKLKIRSEGDLLSKRHRGKPNDDDGRKQGEKRSKAHKRGQFHEDLLSA
jgi:hypothetical protein